MPDRSFISQSEKSMPGFKVSKDRLILLVGGNSSGDCKIEPLLIYHSEKSKAYEEYFQVITTCNLEIQLKIVDYVL